MKAKILLTSMVLPALFAACTSDEIVENNGGSVAGRKTFDPIAITVEEDAETRFAWDAATGTWKGFTAEDKFSAGLVDATQWVVGDNVMTNFVYSNPDGKGFSTPSKMMEGVYFFYSYPGFEKLSNRSAVPFDLSAVQSKIDLADPAANVNAAQLFVSPLYKIEAENADAKLPVQFRSYWSTVGVPVKNTSASSFKIVRIVLESAAEPFVVKGNLKLTALGTANKDNSKLTGLVYSYDKASGTYVLPKDSEGNRISLDEILTKDFATAATDGEQSVIMVDVTNGEVASGKEVTAYIQVPAGLYTNVTAKVYVEVKDEEGNTSVKELTKQLVKGYTDENGAEWVRFRRGYATSAFGKTEAGLAAYEVDDIELLTAPVSTAQYAANYADFAKIAAAAATGTVEIFNIGSLKVDDQVLNLMTRLSGRTVEFSNPIAVSTEASATKSLSNIVFKGGAVVEKGTFDLAAAVLPAGQELTVKAGAKVIVSAVQAGTIINNGTVDINVSAPVGAKITIKHEDKNEATLNVNANAVIDGNAGGCLVLSGKNPKNININGKDDSPIEFKMKGSNTIKSNVTINEYATWTTSAAANDVLTIAEGTVIENYGTIKLGTGTTPAILVNGVQNEDESITKATINNYGTIDGVQIGEYAEIIQKSDAAIVKNIGGIDTDEDATADSFGEIDNSIGGFVNAAAAITVYASYSGTQTGVLGAVQGCNKVIVKNGTWKASATSSMLQNGVKILVAENVTLTTTSSSVSSINLTTATAGSVTLKNCTVSKNLTIGAATTLDATGTTFDGSLTAAAITNSTLDGATFNGAVTLDASGLTALALNGVTINNTFTASNAAAITIGKDQTGVAENKIVKTTTNVNAEVIIKASATLTVNKYATLKVGVNGKIGTTTSTITNNGAIYNQGTIKASSTSTVGDWTGSAPVNS